MTTPKKSFIRKNPTNAFIEVTDTKKEAKPPKAKTSSKGKTPEGYKPNPEYIETKSRRVQALVQPSVYEAVKAKATALGISTNEAINEALRAYTEKT